jgi:hypothetical protein
VRQNLIFKNLLFSKHLESSNDNTQRTVVLQKVGKIMHVRKFYISYSLQQPPSKTFFDYSNESNILKTSYATTFLLDVLHSRPVTIAERPKAWTVFARSDAVIVGSNSTSGMDVWCVCACVRLFCVCVVLYLGRGLATGRSFVQGVLPTMYKSKGKNNLDTVRVRYNRKGYKNITFKRKLPH